MSLRHSGGFGDETSEGETVGGVEPSMRVLRVLNTVDVRTEAGLYIPFVFAVCRTVKRLHPYDTLYVMEGIAYETLASVSMYDRFSVAHQTSVFYCFNMLSGIEGANRGRCTCL